MDTNKLQALLLEGKTLRVKKTEMQPIDFGRPYQWYEYGEFMRNIFVSLYRETVGPFHNASILKSQQNNTAFNEMRHPKLCGRLSKSLCTKRSLTVVKL